jgi:hypothetical protein
MTQGQLNWADFNGLLAVLLGPLGGIFTSAGRGAAWPLIVLFAILGCGIGIASAKLLGRVAYACLHHPRRDVFGFEYMLAALAMPATALIISSAIPAIFFSRGLAA